LSPASAAAPSGFRNATGRIPGSFSWFLRAICNEPGVIRNGLQSPGRTVPASCPLPEEVEREKAESP
jgi:hypothetical protein